MSWCGRFVLVALVAALLAAGCASGRKVVRVPVNDAAPAVAVSGIPQGIDDEALLRTVAAAVKRLGLPLSSPLHAYFYTTPEAFELGLVTDARTDTWFAKDQAAFAVGVGGYYGIFLRADKLAGMTLPNRVGVVAHELTHVSQGELGAGRRGVAGQWLLEGFADWVKYRVLDVLGLRPYAESRALVVRTLRRSTEPFPGLTSLWTNREWTAARQRLGSAATYGQSFFAAEWVVERFGRDAVVTYFRRAAVLNDRNQAFREAFGVPLDQFAEEWSARVEALRRSSALPPDCA